MIKKAVSVLLISAMLFSVVGCGKKETSSKDNTNDSAKETQTGTDRKSVV